MRLRVAAWPLEGAQGTVIMLPGRTEYVEKYARLAAEVAEHGYAMIAIDWRGQGLADRLIADHRIGHVGEFQDYQKDVEALVAAARALTLPRPWHMLAHSMGGAIGLRAAINGLPVESAVFTGPMWGITMSAALRPLAWTISAVSGCLGQGHRLSPSTSYESYVLESAFAGNVLTNDADMWDYMVAQLRAHPELALSGPSVQWVGTALRECRDMAQTPAPELPALTFLGEEEAIVDPAAIHTQMARWPNGTLEIVPDAQHEVLMEGPQIRRKVLDQMVAHFAAYEARVSMI